MIFVLVGFISIASFLLLVWSFIVDLTLGLGLLFFAVASAAVSVFMISRSQRRLGDSEVQFLFSQLQEIYGQEKAIAIHNELLRISGENKSVFMHSVMRINAIIRERPSQLQGEIEKVLQSK